MDSLATQIKEQAITLGFDLVGLTTAVPHEDFSFFKKWVKDGHHGTMGYLERHWDRRANIEKTLPGAQSVICVGMIYETDQVRSMERETATQGWISNYAWGQDYHDIFKDRLKNFATWIQTQIQSEEKFYWGIDTAPFLERSFAARAGLGWIGKNTVLIHPQKGSFFFIGYIITTLKLTAETPLPDRCGSCTRCLDICPTQALTPYHLEATKCIAYLTLEHKGPINDPTLKKGIGTHLAGCDLCQEICPWNDRTRPSHQFTQEKAFEPQPDLVSPSLIILQGWDQKTFREKTKGTPLEWVGFKKWRRNLEIALENSQDETP